MPARDRLRPWAEYLSRRVVLGRRLPARFGRRRIYVSPGSRLAFWHRDLDRVDPELLSLVSHIEPRDCVWDIGANVGMFAFSAAFVAGSDGLVVAVEPDPWLAGLMRRTEATSDRKSAPVVVASLAVGATSGLATLNIARRGRAANFLDESGTTQSGGIRNQQTVMSVTLDGLRELVPQPDVVKIDIEGGELTALTAAQSLLATKRPRFLIEVASENSRDVSRILLEHDYLIFNALAAGEALEAAPAETLALPAEKAPSRPSYVERG